MITVSNSDVIQLVYVCDIFVEANALKDPLLYMFLNKEVKDKFKSIVSRGLPQLSDNPQINPRKERRRKKVH